MKTFRFKFQIGAMILGTFLLVGLWIFLPGKSNSYPSYNGKTVEEWFYGEDRNPGQGQTRIDAGIAFKAIGTNGIPYLIEQARGTETRLNKIDCQIHAKLPTILKNIILPATPASYRQWIAFSHLRKFDPLLLGPYAFDLMEIVPSIKSNPIRAFAFSTIEKPALGSGDKGKITNYLLSFSNDPSYQLRLDAMIRLAWVDNSITNGIPALTASLTARSNAISYVSQLVIPPSSEGHNRNIEGGKHKQPAYDALANIDPELAKPFDIYE